MWRALIFIGLLCGAAFLAVYIVGERPDDLLITWGGYEAQVRASVLVAVGFAVVFLLVWMVERFFSGIINRLSFASRARKRARGYAAVSRGMVAVGAGDPVAARRSAREAERLLGREPLTL